MHRVRLQQMGKLEIRDGDRRRARRFFEEYEQRCYLFIVYEILRRIFLTGVLSMFRAGTISQIAIGLLATIVSHRVFTFYEPYIEDDDDLVSEIAQTELVLVFFYALMVFAMAHVGQRDAAFASDAFTYILIALMSSAFAAAAMAAARGAAKAPPVEAGAVRTDAVRTDAADVAEAQATLGA
ncbi:serine/threonine kinase [Aureococcus anophagefferens]|nr:serine/threonine kinase [Aureococcus anophagefferens]